IDDNVFGVLLFQIILIYYECINIIHVIYVLLPLLQRHVKINFIIISVLYVSINSLIAALDYFRYITKQHI
uniref:hypothetical protein n=2 Tax=Escherichia coli TaxID=562 RepID=UPI001BDB8D15